MYSTVPWSRAFRKAVSDADVDHPYSGTPRHSGSEATTKKKQHWRRGTQLRKAPAGAPTDTAIEKFWQTRLKRNPSVWRPHPARRWCAQLRKTARRNQPPYTHPTQPPKVSRSSQLARVTPQSPSETGAPTSQARKCWSKRNTSPAPAASPFRPNRNSVTHDGPSRPCEPNDSARRRRVRSHLIQAALRAPTVGENEACSVALVEQQDWDETCTSRWPESSRARAERSRAKRRVRNSSPDTQQVSQTQPPPIRVKAASINLRQTLPAVRSPPPHESGGTAS